MEILLLEFDLGTLTVTNNPRSIFVSNLNARIDEVGGETRLFADSDGDGVVDAREEAVGTDPSRIDTDGDELDDLFELRFAGEFDPLATHTPPLTEEQLADEDNDGLNAFIESRLGTDPERADTDADGMPDGLEYRENVNPLVDDMRADPDGDGVANQVVRLTFHTDLQPLEPNKDLSYRVTETPMMGISLDRYVLTEHDWMLVQAPQLPPLAEAEVRFDELAHEPGSLVAGDFECTLADESLLWGSFEAELSRP